MNTGFKSLTARGRHYYIIIGSLIAAVVAASFTYFKPLNDIDYMISDFFYRSVADHDQSSRERDSDIKIISIDEHTVREMENYAYWSRDKLANLIEMLNGGENAPDVIGIDLDLLEKKDSAGDTALVDTCSKYNNICIASVVETTNTETPAATDHGQSDGPPENMLLDKPIFCVGQPFDELLEQVSTGIVNTVKNAPDGFIRSAVSSIKYKGTEYDSFAVAIQRLHVTNRNQEYQPPAVDGDNTFGINFAKERLNFDTYCFLDVIQGSTDMSVFKNNIVLVGDYTTGTTYNIPGQRHEQVPEVVLQANIINALLENNTLQYASKWVLAIWYALFSIAFFTITSYSGKLRSLFDSLLFIALQIALCCLLNSIGYYVPLLQLILLIVVIVITNLVSGYILTKRHKNALETTLRKYVDDQVVDGIVKEGVIDTSIGVVRKDIAVLFVDIRGFTSLSEALPPEHIVDILNHYLTIISHAIARNDGTLDKFIGDAAMAVFNSPFDIEDYVYKAVCTAWDILSNATWLNELCQEKYSRQVAFGIGIHCGDAVVGNIGCEDRMDYTAIGDTVNTSSRLEGSAARGQILISEEVKNRLGDRIDTKFVGDFSLKGKQNTVPAYEVTGIRDYVSIIEEAQDEKRLRMLPALNELLEAAKVSFDNGNI